MNSNNSSRFRASAQIEAGWPARKQARAVPSPIANQAILERFGISSSISVVALTEKGDVKTSIGHVDLGEEPSIFRNGQFLAIV